MLPGAIARDALPVPPTDWTNPSDDAKGEFHANSLMRPVDLARRVLPAVLFQTMQQYATEGVPTDCGPPWPTEVINQAMQTGPQNSALIKENVT